MGLTIGTLSMLSLLSFLSLNIAALNKGIYQNTLNEEESYDVAVTDTKDRYDDYLGIIEEDYTITATVAYDIYKEPTNHIQKLYDHATDYDSVMKLSDYNLILLEKIKRALKLNDPNNFREIAKKDCILDLHLSILKYKEKSIELTRNEFRILYYFFMNDNKIISKEELLEKLWNDKYYFDENVLLVNMTRLKKKMKEIGVVLQNSVKYFNKEENRLTVYSQDKENYVLLIIEDNGCGIKQSEISRVFEKGFTGSNRKKANATGMGLYLAKKLCGRLGLLLEIESKENKYTKVTIIFPKGSVHLLS